VRVYEPLTPSEVIRRRIELQSEMVADIEAVADRVHRSAAAHAASRMQPQDIFRIQLTDDEKFVITESGKDLDATEVQVRSRLAELPLDDVAVSLQLDRIWCFKTLYVNKATGEIFTP